MIGKFARSRIGAALAGLVAASVLSTFVPAPAHAAEPMDCTQQHSHSMPDSFLTPVPDLPCDGGPGDGCRAMPGCASTTPALLGGPLASAPASPALTLPRFATRILHDLLALGPPTPPPNS